MDLTIIILAAGQGTRMKSSLPKVLHPLGGLPMIGHVARAAAALNPVSICVVLPPHDSQISKTLTQLMPTQPFTFVTQDKPLGTGHAVKAALDAFPPTPQGYILVLCGDTPVLQGKTLTQLIHAKKQDALQAPWIYAMNIPHKNTYGRIATDQTGRGRSIVEAACATPEELTIPLCNTGVLLAPGQLLAHFLNQMTPSPTGEFYLTDFIAYAAAHGKSSGLLVGPEEEFCGVNTRVDLSKAEAHLQNRWRTQAMMNGVTLMDPSSVYFSYDTVIGQDSIIYPHVYFGPQVTLGEGVTVRPFSMLTGATLDQGTRIGPCTHLRPGAHLKTGSRVGNFVEVKNTTLESGAHADHLTYLGDSHLGVNAAIGAGTITCNYNGFEKFKTQIGAHAFVGSNTTLVAPVCVGEGAIIAAGSVVTHDVEPEALVFARAKQVQRSGYGKKFREKSQKGK